MHDAAHVPSHMKGVNYGRPATMHGHGNARAQSQDDVFGSNGMSGEGRSMSGDRFASISPPGYSITPNHASGILRNASWNGNGSAAMLGGSSDANMEHAIMDR